MDGHDDLSPLSDSRRFPSGPCSWRSVKAAGGGAGRAGTIKRGEKDENVREHVRDALVRELGTRGAGLDVW